MHPRQVIRNNVLTRASINVSFSATHTYTYATRRSADCEREVRKARHSVGSSATFDATRLCPLSAGRVFFLSDHFPFRGSPLLATSFAGGLATAMTNAIIMSAQSARWNCTRRRSRFPIYPEETAFQPSSPRLHLIIVLFRHRVNARRAFLISSTCFCTFVVFFFFLFFPLRSTFSLPLWPRYYYCVHGWSWRSINDFGTHVILSTAGMRHRRFFCRKYTNFFLIEFHCFPSSNIQRGQTFRTLRKSAS